MPNFRLLGVEAVICRDWRKFTRLVFQLRARSQPASVRLICAKQSAGYSGSGAGCWVLGAGCWLLVAGCGPSANPTAKKACIIGAILHPGRQSYNHVMTLGVRVPLPLQRMQANADKVGLSAQPRAC